MVKCESLRINMFRITLTGKSVNFPVTKVFDGIFSCLQIVNLLEGRVIATYQHETQQ